MSGKYKTILMISLLMILPLSAQIREVRINEFLASNRKVNLDDFGKSSDWIELYNSSDSGISLKDYSLTDNPAKPRRWIFPDIILPARAFLLIWASGRDLKSGSSYHTNFKLSASGEFIGLYAPDNSVVDSLTFGPQQADISFGRLPSDSSVWKFNRPTPAAPNRMYTMLSVSPAQGHYDQAVSLHISADIAGVTIKYTTDGKTPDISSPTVTDPLQLSSSCVIRALAFENDTAVSAVSTRLYVIDENPSLPLLSLTTEPDNLWNSDYGIYTNWDKRGKDWERPVNVSLIENGETKFSISAGFRIHGQTSRTKPKKGFRLYFKSEYGEQRLKYRLFPGLDLDEFDTLVIYPPSSDNPSGYQFYTLLYDVLSHALWAEEGGVTSAYKPVVAYLNGSYWGIYWIREHMDKYYMKSHYGIKDPDHIRAEWSEYGLVVKEGDTDYWNEAFSFIRHNSLKNEDNYQKVINEYLDIDNFTDYFIMNIHAGNLDWPQKNIDWFRERAPRSRFRWLMWDVDYSWRFDPNSLSLEWATRSTVRTDIRANDNDGLLWSTLIIRKLLEKESYRIKFVNRFADLMNTTLSADHVNAKMTELQSLIEPEMKREISRWNDPVNHYWNNNLAIMRHFIGKRCYYMRLQLSRKFNLGYTRKLTLSPAQGCKEIRLNSLAIEGLPWSGEYFRKIPVTVKAIALPGYRFTGWSDPALPSKPEISVTLSGDITLQPLFETYIPLEISNINAEQITDTSALLTWESNIPVLGFINYGIDTTLGSFLYCDSRAATRHSASLTGLTPETGYYYRIFSVDSGGDTSYTAIHTFTTQKKEAVFPQISNIETCNITATTAEIKWTTDIPTRGLVHYGQDTLLALLARSAADSSLTHQVDLSELAPATRYFFRVVSQSIAGNESQSPLDSFYTGDNSEVPPGTREKTLAFGLRQNYPNPFNPRTLIEYTIPSRTKVTLDVYNLAGEKVAVLVNSIKTPGNYHIDFSAAGLASGLYFYKLTADDKVIIKKMTILR